MPGEDINTTLRFNADITDFKAAMQEANRATKLANSEFKAVSAGMDDWSSSTDGLTAKLKQLATVQEAEERKLDVLKTAYQQVVQEQGENSAAAIDLATKINNQQAVVNKTAKAHDKYAAQLESVEKSADGATDDIKDAGKAAKDAGEAAEESAEGWTIVKDVIADLVKDALSWAIESFGELMTASSSALSTLGARTGATTEQLNKYNGVMKEIYRNNYGESFEDISDAMGTAVQMFGELDNASLQNVTENAIALRDTFDMDYSESMRAVNSLMDQFGISADEAFNLVAQGAQQGLNQNGDLLDVINEYSVQFASAGYSADDMFNMLKNGAESGTWSVDKLGDAVKEFNIRAKDGTASEALGEYRKALGLSNADVKRLSASLTAGGAEGQAAYNEILGALGNVSDEQTRYQAGVALFGTMWEDLGEDAVTALMETQGGITSTKTAMDQLKEVKYDNLTDAMSALGRIIQSDLIRPLVDTLEPIARTLVEWLIENMDVLKPIIVGVATAVGVLAAALAISGVISSVQKAFALLNTTLLANPITLVVAALAALAAGIAYAWQNSETFREIVLAAWEAVKNGIGVAVEAVTTWFGNLVDWLSELPDKMSTAISGAISAVTTWGAEVYAAAKDKISSTISGVVSWLSELPGKMYSAISGAVLKVTTWGTGVYNAAKTKISSTISGIVSWLTQLPGKMYSAISGAVQKVAAWGSSLASKGKQAATQLWNAVVNKIKNLPQQVVSVGKNLVSGLWNGVNDKLQWLKNKLSSFTSSVLSSIKSFFGVHSPSKETYWIGEMLTAGFAEALEDGKKTVAAAMEDMGSAGLDALNGVSVTGATGAGSSGKTIIINQTNNSPKALSRLEIYRQTHNALAYAGGVL